MIFSSKKSKLETNLDTYIDAENCQELIYDGFRTIRALNRGENHRLFHTSVQKSGPNDPIFSRLCAAIYDFHQDSVLESL